MPHLWDLMTLWLEPGWAPTCEAGRLTTGGCLPRGHHGATTWHTALGTCHTPGNEELRVGQTALQKESLDRSLPQPPAQERAQEHPTQASWTCPSRDPPATLLALLPGRSGLDLRTCKRFDGSCPSDSS